jgi:hypothetical protein
VPHFSEKFLDVAARRATSSPVHIGHPMKKISCAFPLLLLTTLTQAHVLLDPAAAALLEVLDILAGEDHSH